MDNEATLQSIQPARVLTRVKPVKVQTIRSMKRRESWLGYSFLLPCFILFGVFLFYPAVQSIYLSFQTTDPRGIVAGFAGISNYTALLTSKAFIDSLKVTGLFTLYTVPAGIIIALFLAMLTNVQRRGMKLFQFAFSLPIVISAGTGAVIWSLLFHPSTGMLNYFLSLLGQDPVFWLVDPKKALLSISFMTVWMNLGFNFIVLLGGLKSISQDIYDCMKIDGPGPLRSLTSVIFPLLSPTLFFLLIVSVIHALQAFGQIHILTKGGPMNSTNVMVYQIYQEAFVNYRFGTGSAQALVLFMMILALTLVQFFALERKVHYQ